MINSDFVQLLSRSKCVALSNESSAKQDHLSFSALWQLPMALKAASEVTRALLTVPMVTASAGQWDVVGTEELPQLWPVPCVPSVSPSPTHHNWHVHRREIQGVRHLVRHQWRCKTPSLLCDHLAVLLVNKLYESLNKCFPLSCITPRFNHLCRATIQCQLTAAGNKRKWASWWQCFKAR